MKKVVQVDQQNENNSMLGVTVSASNEKKKKLRGCRKEQKTKEVSTRNGESRVAAKEGDGLDVDGIPRTVGNVVGDHGHVAAHHRRHVSGRS